MAIALPDRVTPEAYLAFERASEERHELIDGEVVAMSGVSRRHATLAGNLLAAIHRQLRARGWPCSIFGSRMRIRVATFYTYPDISVGCGEPRFEDDELDTLLDPTLLVEVLSPSTAAYDRGEKWERYRSLPSLREYVLVDQDRVHVERFLRRPDGTWLFSELDDPAAALRLESIGCETALAELYEDVDFGLAGGA